MRLALATACSGLLLLAAAGPAARAEELQPQGWHVVRPGDTLQGLTRTYTGSFEPWRENWGLNTFVTDPDLLQPGWRLRLLLQPLRSRPAAQLLQVARRVETKPAPQPWGAAQVGDLLLDRDAVRTFEDSSAELGFTDGGSLRLTESSLVFLVRPVRGGDAGRRAVEIVEGQADLDLGPGATRRQVEVIAGPARGSLSAGPESEGSSRTRRLPAGDSHWMVYRGQGAVAAAGARVELPAGTGSKVAPKAPPTPPEPLLPAPRTLPVRGTATVAARLQLAWEAVPGAVGYVAELCGEATCATPIERAVGLTQTGWRPAPVDPGAYFWRVNAVAASGLDGFPSPPQALAALDREPDTQGPESRLGVGGPHLELADGYLFGGDAIVRLTASDAGSGVAKRIVFIDGDEAPEERLAGPWASGEHRVEARVVDGAGNESRVGPLVFQVDADGPGIVFEPSPPAESSRSTWRMLSELAWRADRGWTAWQWVSGQRKLGSDVVRGRWSLVENAPTVIFALARSGQLRDGIELAVEAGSSLAVSALDDPAGVESFSLRPKQQTVGDRQILVLYFEAADRLGNSSHLRVEAYPD